jgi:hypothetical protein
VEWRLRNKDRKRRKTIMEKESIQEDGKASNPIERVFQDSDLERR